MLKAKTTKQPNIYNTDKDYRKILLTAAEYKFIRIAGLVADLTIKDLLLEAIKKVLQDKNYDFKKSHKQKDKSCKWYTFEINSQQIIKMKHLEINSEVNQTTIIYNACLDIIEQGKKVKFG